MKHSTKTAIQRAGQLLFSALPLILIMLITAGCGGTDKKKPGNTVLSTRTGETGIQVTESEEGGQQIVRVTTTFRGEVSTVVMAIDESNYEVEIPLSLSQTMPTGSARGGPAGDFQDLLTAQYLEKSQVSMMEGNYNEALRQVNLVLMVRPEHVKAHEMKGSIYYAMGSYELANEEWEQVLTLDPSNEEVRKFMDFNRNQPGAPQPGLPAELQGGPQPGQGSVAPPALPAGEPAAQPAAQPAASPAAPPAGEPQGATP